MGICFGWLSRGNLLTHQNPPPLDREETYKDCKIYFHESQEKADQLQQNFVSVFLLALNVLHLINLSVFSLLLICDLSLTK